MRKFFLPILVSLSGFACSSLLFAMYTESSAEDGFRSGVGAIAFTPINYTVGVGLMLQHGFGLVLLFVALCIGLGFWSLRLRIDRPLLATSVLAVSGAGLGVINTILFIAMMGV